MSNMSYCRFQNTQRDFRDCSSALQEMVEGGSDEAVLSRDELYAAKMLVSEAVELLEFLADYIGKDVEDIFKGMQRPSMVFEQAVQLLNDEAKEMWDEMTADEARNTTNDE